MSRFGQQEQEAGGAVVMRPTGQCGCSGCARETSINLAAAFSPNGHAIVAPALDVVTRDWRIRPGYTLRGWIDRCAYCYSMDRLREERIRHFKDTGEIHPIPDWSHEPYRSVQSAEQFQEFFGGQSISQVIAGVAA